MTRKVSKNSGLRSCIRKGNQDQTDNDTTYQEFADAIKKTASLVHSDHAPPLPSLKEDANTEFTRSLTKGAVTHTTPSITYTTLSITGTTPLQM
jgi:hypothetical protein